MFDWLELTSQQWECWGLHREGDGTEAKGEWWDLAAGNCGTVDKKMTVFGWAKKVVGKTCEKAQGSEYQWFLMPITVSGQTACTPCLGFEGYAKDLYLGRLT